MHKKDPDDVRADFAASIDDLTGYMGRSRRVLKGAIHEKKDLSRLSNTSFFSLYVSFETFLSDLFLASVATEGGTRNH